MSSKLESIGIYVGCLVLLIMAWQGWRDLHKDMSDIKERLKALEIVTEYEIRFREEIGGL